MLPGQLFVPYFNLQAQEKMMKNPISKFVRLLAGRRENAPVGLMRRGLLFAAVSLVVSSSFLASLPAAADDRKDDRWVGTWTASPQAPEPPIIPAVPAQFDNQTVRQIIHTSIGGSTIRIRFSNEYGTAPLTIGAASVARQSTGAGVVAGTLRQLTFAGQSSVTIPAGAPMLSDPVELGVPALGNLSVSIFLPKATPTNTFHSLGLSTSYISGNGNFTAAAVMPSASTSLSWYFLSGATVVASKKNAAIITIGDSITDGFASTPDTNRRWPNVFAARLQARNELKHLAVLNHGISGNRTLFNLIGPNALARFDRDVLSAPGAKFVILLEGINNIGIPGAFGLPGEVVTADEIIAGHKQLIARAHERGLKIYGGTLTPFEGTTFPGYYTAAGEVKRQAVNNWIRTSRAFDAVIDFDKIIRDPANPIRMLPAFDSGDHLHPNDAGYAAMANGIDLALFRGDEGDDD
jgi:lysophospholipase L1-like esterase